MGENMKTIITGFIIGLATISVLHLFKMLFGAGVVIAVFMAVLAFCIGAMWGAGKDNRP